MTRKNGMHCFVSGTVQGVWYRANTKKQADQLNITGYARNLPDGRVEVLAYGDDDALKQLHTWLHQGPPRAEVTDVTHETVEWREYVGFKVM